MLFSEEIHVNLLASINDTATIAPAVILIVGLVVVAIAVVAVAVFIIGRYHTYANGNTLYVGKSKEEGGKLKTWHMFLIIVALGLLIRLLLTFFIKGFYPAYENEYLMADWIVNKGYAGFYTSGGFDTSISSPLMTYIYFITAGLGRAMGLTSSDVMMSFFIKLPYLIADIVLAFAVYRVASKHINRYVGLAIGGIIMLCPVFFVMSGMWGSAYSVYAVVAFFAFYYLLKRNIPMMTVFMTLLFSLMPEALFLAPVFFGYMVYLLVKAIMAIVKEKPSFDNAMNDGIMKNVVDVPVCLILSICAMYLIALPAYFPDYGANFFTVYNQLFFQPLEAISHFGKNALNIFNIFGQNYIAFGGDFPTLIFGLLFLALILAVVLVIFLTKKNRANLVLIGSFVICTVTTYFVGASEWSMMPSLVLLLLAFIVIQDKRLLKIFSIFSVIYLVNGLFAMLYSNSISMTVTGSTVSDAALTSSNAPVGFVFSIIFSVIAVITHLYYTVVMLDISMTKHRCLFNERNRDMSFLQSIGAFIRSK